MAIGLQQLLTDLETDQVAITAPQQLMARVRGVAAERKLPTVSRGSFRSGSSALRLPARTITSNPLIDEVDFFAPGARRVPSPLDDEALTPPSSLSVDPLSIPSDGEYQNVLLSARRKDEALPSSAAAALGSGGAISYVVDCYLSQLRSTNPLVMASLAGEPDAPLAESSERPRTSADGVYSSRTPHGVFSMSFVQHLRRRIAEDHGARRDTMVLAACLPVSMSHCVFLPSFDDLYRSLLIAYHLDAAA